MSQSRLSFRDQCVDRDGGECIVPWCDKPVTVDPDGPGEVHHIIERELWQDGGYVPKNGASVCNHHHQLAERNEIPPQSFWRWIVNGSSTDGTYIPLPRDTARGTHRSTDSGTVGVWAESENAAVYAVDKWGEPFDTPPHGELREYAKYPSTRHLLPLYWESTRGTAEEQTGRDDTGLTDVSSFTEIPLVATTKMDGSNTMLVADADEPVRARNGREADHESFDLLKQDYWDRGVIDVLPEHLQVFGENMYAKHSIHYGCEGCCDERNRGPAVDDVFLVFGVYDTRFDLWLSWPEVESVAEKIGFSTPTTREYDPLNEIEFRKLIGDLAEKAVDGGHEGIVVRSKFPFHYGQFPRKVGKYVRPNHVQTDEHWSHGQATENVIRNG